MKHSKQLLRNIPNLLSAYRILAIPFIVFFIHREDKNVFIILLSVNLITDILDGLIARTFKLETEFGARLDSIADVGTYVMAVYGLIKLENDFVSKHSIEFSILVILYIIPYIICIIRWKRFPSLHLYLSKLTGYIQGIFMFSYFVFGYSAWYFYLMIAISYLNYIEELLFVLILPQMKSNVKGLYWYMKEKGNR